MLFKKKNRVKQKSMNPISLGIFIFSVKQHFKGLTDHALIAHLVNEKFKQTITKEDIDDYYGYNDIMVECYEDESRKHIYKLQV